MDYGFKVPIYLGHVRLEEVVIPVHVFIRDLGSKRFEVTLILTRENDTWP